MGHFFSFLKRYAGAEIVALIVILAGFSAVHAVTTLNLNIATDGTLSVTGATNLSADLYSTDGALFNISSTTAFLIQNGSGTNHFLIDTSSATASTTQLGGLVVDTSTLVANANENRVGIGTAAPTTTLTVVGTTRLNGTLRLTDGATFDSTLSLGGSLTLQNSDVIGNTTAANVFISGTTISIATTSASTTAGSLWVGAPAATATSTLQLGGNPSGANGSGTQGSCMQMWRENSAYRMYIAPSSTAITSNGFILKVEPGSCRD